MSTDKTVLRHIGVGLSRWGPAGEKDFRTFPGWNTDWAYHGDDGKYYIGTGKGTCYASTYTKGDKIGCGVDYSKARIYYTKNGRFLGERPQPIPGPRIL